MPCYDPALAADASEVASRRQIVLDLLIDSSWGLREIANHLHLSVRATSPLLDALVAEGVISRTPSRRYTSARSPFAYKRPQPVRDDILRALTESRRATEIAALLGKPTAAITPHLAAMAKLNLVVRLRRGFYARPPEPVEPNGQGTLLLTGRP